MPRHAHRPQRRRGAHRRPAAAPAGIPGAPADCHAVAQLRRRRARASVHGLGARSGTGSDLPGCDQVRAPLRSVLGSGDPRRVVGSRESPTPGRGSREDATRQIHAIALRSSEIAEMTAVLGDTRLAHRLVQPLVTQLEEGANVRRDARGPSVVASPGAHRSEGRCATATMLAALTTGLAAVREPRLVRERFEEQLRSLVNASSVAFRTEDEGPVGPGNVVLLDVPASRMAGRPRLEAVFDPTRRVDDRTRQMLSAAALVAGLLVEI